MQLRADGNSVATTVLPSFGAVPRDRRIACRFYETLWSDHLWCRQGPLCRWSLHRDSGACVRLGASPTERPFRAGNSYYLLIGTTNQVDAAASHPIGRATPPRYRSRRMGGKDCGSERALLLFGVHSDGLA